MARIGGVVTPAGGVLTATTDSDGRYAIAGAPEGSYAKLTIQPPAGYGAAEVAKVVVQGGQTATRDVALRRNWALLVGGATVTSSDGSYGAACGVHGLIDGSRTNGWSAANPTSPNASGAPVPVATVTFPRAVEVAAIAIDPGSTCGNGPSATLKGYRLEVSRDGTTFEPYAQGQFASADAGHLVSIPAPGGSPVRAAKVRLTMLSPQSACVGCAGRDFIDIQELEVLGAVPNQLPTGQLTAAPSTASPGQEVAFTAAFTDPDSVITGYDWDFDGDGAVDRSTSAPTTSFAYGAAGGYAASVAAKDFRGGGGTGTTIVQVSAPAEPTVPTPTPTPSPEPAEPIISIAATGTGGRLTVRVTCAARCTLSGRLTVSRRVARRLGLARRLIGTVPSTTITSTARRTFRVPLSAATLRAVKRAGLRSVRVSASVTARYADGRRTTARRTVTVRR